MSNNNDVPLPAKNWLLQLMGDHDFTIPTEAFDELAAALAAPPAPATADRAALAEADRRAGAAERELAEAQEDLQRLARVRREMKQQWGVNDNVSFDVVWAEALALKAATPAPAAGALRKFIPRKFDAIERAVTIAGMMGASIGMGYAHRHEVEAYKAELREHLRAVIPDNEPDAAPEAPGTQDGEADSAVAELRVTHIDYGDYLRQVEGIELTVAGRKLGAGTYQLYLRPHRFASTSCSQCGQDFGPGDSGFSHCEDHRKLASRNVASDASGSVETLAVLARFLGINEEEEKARPGYDGSAPVSHIFMAAIERFGKDRPNELPNNWRAVQAQADAWLQVAATLEEVAPWWQDNPATGRESAVAAIRKLALRPVAPEAPDTQDGEAPEARTDVAWWVIVEGVGQVGMVSAKDEADAEDEALRNFGTLGSRGRQQMNDKSVFEDDNYRFERVGSAPNPEAAARREAFRAKKGKQ